MRIWSLLVCLSIALLSQVEAQAQYSGSPIPGNFSPVAGDTQGQNSAPVPGQSKVNKSPKQVNKRLAKPVIPNPALVRQSLYKQLPLTLDGAKIKIEELNNLVEVTDFNQPAAKTALKNRIYALSEWLQDVANAHWRMYKAFDKSPATKLKAKTERETALAFSHLKNKAKLLKAELFIKQNRQPEALEPLVDIVVAEPRTETGKKAYQRLIDMGFSPKDKSLEIATTEENQKK